LENKKFCFIKEIIAKGDFMKRYLKITSITIIIIVIISIIIMVLMSCTRRASTSETLDSSEFTIYEENIYELIEGTEALHTFSGNKASANTNESEYIILGEWRYVISRSNTTGDLYEEERLSYPATSVLRISRNYNDDLFTEIFSYAGMYVYYGVLTKTDNDIYHFKAGYIKESGVDYIAQINETFVFIYDPAAGNLGWDDIDMNLMRYYERVGYAESPPQITSTQESNQNSRLYGNWENENKSLNTLMFLEPNILYEEGGTTIVGGRNSFIYSYDGKTLTIKEGNNEHSNAQANINEDILTIGPFEGGHDWHYNLFLWGTFRKTQ